MIRDTGNAKTASLTTAIGTTEEMPKSGMAWGDVYIPTGSSITTLTWWKAPALVAGNSFEAGTYLPAYDDDLTSPAAIVQTVAGGNSYPIPAALASAPFLKAVSNAAGDIIVQFSS